MRARSFLVPVAAFLIGCTAAVPPTATLAPATVAPPTAAPATAAPPTAAPSPAVPPTAAPPTAAPITPAPTPTAAPTPAPTAAARTIVSDDGALTIDIPPGALPADVAMTATAQGSEDLPPELEGVNVRTAFYRLEPDGLTFAEPVTITRRVTLEELGYDLETDGVPIISQALRTSDGAWEWLASQEQDLTEDGTIEIAGQASHTSSVFGLGGSTFLNYEVSEPSLNVPVGERLEVQGTLKYSGTGAWPQIAGVEAVYDPGVVEPELPAFDATTFVQAFECMAAGSSWVGVDIGLGNLNAGSELLQSLGLGPVPGELYIGATLNCFQDSEPSPIVVDLPSYCVRVVHESLGEYLSYLDWTFWYEEVGYVVDYFEVTVQGANDDDPVRLDYDPEDDWWYGQLGLRNAGPKKIAKLVAYLIDGTEVDLTSNLIDAFGEDFEVRFPQTDQWGSCDSLPALQ